jgi:putative ABC transport system permease protein
MALTDWTIVTRSLTGRMFSTVTTSLTVAAAVGLLLVLLMMRESGRKAFARGSGDMHLLVSADASPLVSILNGVFYANPPRRPITWTKYQQLRASAPWDYFIPTQQGDSYRGAIPVLATLPEFFTKFKPNVGEPWRLREGRFFEKSFEVVLGAAAARSTSLRVGDQIILTHGISQSRDLGDYQAGKAAHEHAEYKYAVVGILEPTGGSHDRAMFTDLDSSWIIHAHDRRRHADPDVTNTTAADLIDADRLITGIYTRLITREGSDTPANLPQVFDQLRRDTSVTVAQPRQEIDQLFKIVGNIDQIFVGMAVVVMITSGIGIMLALYNSMEQRRRQIAVLRVLGCSRGRVFGLVITESALLGMIGAGVGVAVAVVGVRVVAGVMKQRLGLAIDPTLPLHAALLVVVAAIALASIAGLVPAVMAYRTSVAKNLRPIG